MCEFCREIYKPLTDNDKPVIIYGNYCSKDNDMYYISVPTDDGIEYTVDNINYCPMCGRDLRGKSEND